MRRQLLLILFCVATTTARAHSVWIELNAAQQPVIRFAEPGNDFETSPGYLDKLSPPLAFELVTNAPATIAVLKGSDHFSLGGVAATSTVCVETSFTVRGGRKPLFYARWQPAWMESTKPLLTLDAVPTGKPGEVRVYFRGQPLGGIKATLRAPGAKEEELTADAAGFIRFTATQPGSYLLTIAHHRESLAGFHHGVAYKETSHNCSLSWQQR